MRRTGLCGVDEAGFSLLNGWQRGFPLHPRPFAQIGATLALSEEQVLRRYRNLSARRLISRIGAVFRPHRVGTSVLAALAAPEHRIDEIAARISREPTVNHNYQREHRLNLWFVITTADAAQLHATAERLTHATGCEVILLPLEEAFHIDLGFDLRGVADRPARRDRADVGFAPRDSACAQPELRRRLVHALQPGLALLPRPYATLGEVVDMREEWVLETLDGWLADSTLSRFGVVVRHHELGLTANAMCVWDVPDGAVSALGRRLADEAAVTLCYRRRRAAAVWRYNLFCMIYGSDRIAVAAEHAAIAARVGLDAYPGEVLFSVRRFKQTGAQYVTPTVGCDG